MSRALVKKNAQLIKFEKALKINLKKRRNDNIIRQMDKKNG